MNKYPCSVLSGKRCKVVNIEGSSKIKERRKICIDMLPLDGFSCSVEECTDKAHVRAHITDGQYAFLCRMCYKHNHYRNKSSMILKYREILIYLGPIDSFKEKLITKKIEDSIPIHVDKKEEGTSWLGIGIICTIGLGIWSILRR